MILILALQDFSGKIPIETLNSMAEKFYQSCPQSVCGVFGYGSLIWKFDDLFDEKLVSKIYGYRRSLGLWSYYYRGSEANPGLVFGLDKGGSTKGVTYFCYNEEQRKRMITNIFKREMVSCAYRPMIIKAHIYREPFAKLGAQNYTQKPVLTFVLERKHRQYAGKMALDRQKKIIAKASGVAGSNRDYVLFTEQKLQEFKINCKMLRQLCQAL